MNEFRIKLGENGRVLIPASCRRQLKLVPGQELIIKIEDEELHLFSLDHSVRKAQQLVKKYAKNQNLVEKLIKSRREDELNE